MSSLLSRLLTTVLLLTIVAACSSTENTMQSSDQSSATEIEDERKAELEKLYYARQDSARMNFTEADTEFMVGMIAHHAQALIMSDLAKENNASSQIKVLAARIINAQKDEIKSMQKWLRDRDQKVPEVHIEGLNLMIHGLGEGHAHMDHTNMAGMLSPAQLKELSEATGSEYDRLFLKYMIQHHKGAVTMVDKLFSTDGAALDEGSFRLATDIRVDQKTEIARMQLMLDDMTASSNE